jgi:hypothetical protein
MQGDVGFEEAFRPKPKNNVDIGFTWQNRYPFYYYYFFKYKALSIFKFLTYFI